MTNRKKIFIFVFILILSLSFNVYANNKSGFVTENGKTYYYDESGNLMKWWQVDENGVFYLQNDGSIKQGLQEINGIMYYIENNYIYSGEKEINNEMYVFSDLTGEMKYGIIRLSDNSLIYVEKNGKHYSDGWIESNGKKYYQKNKRIVEDFQKIGEKTYYFEPNTGKLKQWWQVDNNGVFYLQNDGSIKQGLQEINGIMYYIENNYIYYGEKEINNEMYVFSDLTGEMKYGSIRLSDNSLIYVEKNGKHYSDGWIESNGKKYYQKNKRIVEGFQKIGEKTYYFEPNTGKLKQWWQVDNNGVFYLQNDGSIKQGLQEINGIMYYIENNYIYYGEKEINNEMYVFSDLTGEMKYGSIRLSDNSLIYVEKNGKHYSDGWIESNGKKYYQKNKRIVEGFQKIGEKTYYFEPNTGKLKQWWQVDEKGVFYLQSDGSVKQGLQSIDGILYYIENNYIYYGEKEINGEVYVFQEGTGELKSGIFKDSNGNIRYVEKDGRHPKGWIRYNGYIYYIDLNGIGLVDINNVDGREYYFGEDGVLWGFYWENNKMYYKNPDGSLAKGVQYIGGQYIQFNDETGAFEKYLHQIRVIDVSAHQGYIDWQQVKDSGLVDAVILRLGYSDSFVDRYFLSNKKELERLGIPYSVYLFSYAENKYEASLEANFVVNTILNNNVHIASNMLGIYYDLEDWEIKSTGQNSYGISKEDYGEMITTFVDIVESKLCIKTRVYASENYIYTRFPEYTYKYMGWIANWTKAGITYQGTYDGWQYTSKGNVPGVAWGYNYDTNQYEPSLDMSYFYY